MKKKKMKFERKLMAFLLALVMVVGIMPGIGVTVRADENTHTHDNITFTAWESANTLPSVAGNYYLTQDVTISQTWVVPSGTVNLCLNGYGIRNDRDANSTSPAIKVNAGATLNLYSCREDEHKFTVADDSDMNYFGLATVDDTLTEGYQTFNGGYITGGNFNTGGGFGGGISLEGGNVTLGANCTLIGNRAGWGGGAVCIESGNFTMKPSSSMKYNRAGTGGCISVKWGTFTMEGGSIDHNIGCSAVHLYKDSYGRDGTFRMIGGMVTDNYSFSTADWSAGGVLAENGKFIIEGGSITNNHTANNNYPIGGVKQVYCTIEVKGSPVIQDNTYGSDNKPGNMYIPNGKTIKVSDALGSDAIIGVSMGNPGVFTTNGETYNDSSKFTSDDQNYAVGMNNANQLYLGTKCTVTFNTGGKGTAPESQIVASGSKTTSPSDPVAEGYTFDGWYKEESLSNKWDFDTDVVTGNITLYAKWNKSYTVTFKVANGAWDDGEGDASTADKTVILTGSESDTLKLATDQIPAVGTKPNSGYEAGNWDVTPNTETEITADTVYTYTFALSAPSGDDDGGNTPGGDTPAPSDSGEGGSDTPASDSVTPSGDEGTNGSQGTDGATGYVKDVTGTDEAAGNYSLSQKIVNNGELKTLLSLSDDEVSQGTKVWLDVADLGNNAPDSDKALVESAKGDYTIGTYLDINLFKKVGNNEAVKITQTNGNVKVSLVLPENLRKEGRTFGIVRVHDDMAALIAASYAGDSHALSFETDGFSTYAIVYKDGTATGGNTSSNTSTSTDNSSSGSNNTTTTTTSTVVPKTDGMSGIMVWSLMLILSLSTLGVVAFMRVKENR